MDTIVALIDGAGKIVFTGWEVAVKVCCLSAYQKAAITHRFLQRKVEEYEALKAEIQALQSEVGKTGGAGSQES